MADVDQADLRSRLQQALEGVCPRCGCRHGVPTFRVIGSEVGVAISTLNRFASGKGGLREDNARALASFLERRSKHAVPS